MPIYRVDKTDNYTVMCNHPLRDARLSWKAKGMLSYILSLPDAWDFSAVGLAAAGRDGVTTVRSALTELEGAGYLIRRPIRSDDGRIADWEYTIYEMPHEPEPCVTEHETDQPDAENPVAENPQVEKPQADLPEAENRTQLNTNILNTKIANTNTNILVSAEEADVERRLADAEAVVDGAVKTLKKSAEDKAAAAERFARWWEVWPRKVARKAAERAFERIAPDDELLDRMIAAVRTQMERDSRFREAQYTPHPATWLNGEEWNNTYDGTAGGSQSFDTDEFFAAAVENSLRQIGAT